MMPGDLPEHALPGASRLAARILRLFGWRVVFRPPPPKAVLIVYPQTSNWDFPIGLLARYATGIWVRWVGKDTLFRGPFDAIFRRLGGIPVNRRERTGFVDQMHRLFDESPRLLVGITPEGTRKRTDCWKSGFYHVALAAKVPLGLVFIDYARKEVGVDTYLELSGDREWDMEEIRRHYAGRRGRYPDQEAPIRLRDAD